MLSRPDELAMGHKPGTGRREAQILAHLDGIPRELHELAIEIAGGPPTRAEFNALSRAGQQLARAGLITITRVNRGKGGGMGSPKAILLKVSRWVADTDGSTGTDAQVSHADWLDAAWQGMAWDIAVAEDICRAAAGLLTEAELAADRRRRVQVGDCDRGAADEVRRLRVVDVGRELPVVDPAAPWRGRLSSHSPLVLTAGTAGQV